MGGTNEGVAGGVPAVARVGGGKGGTVVGGGLPFEVGVRTDMFTL